MQAAAAARYRLRSDVKQLRVPGINRKRESILVYLCKITIACIPLSNRGH